MEMKVAPEAFGAEAQRLLKFRAPAAHLAPNRKQLIIKVHERQTSTVYRVDAAIHLPKRDHNMKAYSHKATTASNGCSG